MRSAGDAACELLAERLAQRFRQRVQDLCRESVREQRARIALADRALRRLTLRQRRMLHQGKHPNLVNIAIARELVGFVWNVLHPASPVTA